MAESQKFIARNRAPRVQIEYDVELYGAEKKVQLPFVMGVMSDLSGKSKVAQPSVDDRRFLEIDVDSFDDRMKAMQPRVEFSVPNTLTGEGNLPVDLVFERIEDFSPSAIAAKIAPLKALLDARTELSNLMAYMDGKSGAEALIEKILANPALLAAASGAAVADSAETDAALAALRASAPAGTAPKDTTDATLARLAAAAPVDAPAEDPLAALGTLTPVEEVAAQDTTADTLAGLAAAAPFDAPSEDPLAALTTLTPVAEAEIVDTTADTLAGLASSAPADAPAEDPLAALGTLTPVEEVEAQDTTDDTLAGLAAAAPVETVEEDTLAALGTLTPVEEVQTKDTTADTLDSLAAAAPVDAPAEDPLAALDSLEPVEETAAEDDTADTLAGLAAAAPVETVEEDALSALGTLTPVAEQDEIDTSADALAGLASAAPQDAPAEDPLAALDSLAPVEETVAEDTTADTLADLAAAPQESPADDPLAALDSLEPVDVVEPEDLTAETLATLSQADEAEPQADPREALDSLAALDAPAAEDGCDDVLAGLAASEAEAQTVPEADDLDDVLGDLTGDTELSDLLETPESAPDTAEDAGGLDDLLGGLSADSGLDDLLADPAPQAGAAAQDSLDDLLGDPAVEDGLDDLLAAADPDPDDVVAKSPEPETGAGDNLDDLLGGLADDDPLETPEPTEEPADDLGAVLGDLADDAAPAVPEAEPAPEPSDDLDDLLGDLTSDDGLSDLLDAPEPAAEPQQDTEEDDLGDLLGDLAGDAPAAEAAPETATQGDELDDLLGGLAGDDPLESSEPTPAPVDDLDDLLGDLTTGDGLDDLLADPDTPPETEPALEIARPAEPEFAFGTIAGERPAPEKLNRKRFRMAILGDFSGRAARGLVDTGDGLASRAAMPLDPDTADDLIESFATTLVLPIGKDGTGVEVKLGELDDLHPDELFEKLPLFADLVGLKAQLGAGGTAESAALKLRQWAEQHGTYAAPARRTSSGNAMPAGKRLTDFQALIGDTSGQLTQPSAIEDLLARVVGPHIRAVPDADAQAMQQAVDQSIAAAMRLILHHPEFQSLEAQWRSIDLIARSIEADDTLDVVLYDVSAEEIAADLARADDLSQSGLARMLTEAPLDEDTGRGGFSAILGLYTFEETPPHAQILGRIARVAAHVDAPFFGAMAAGTLDTDKTDRHPLVAEAWDELRGMAEAKYLGLATPRFMLRRPYGAKTEPTYEFDFEEFTMQDGLKSLLWANPVVLVAILLAQSFRANGKGMNLGSVMGLGGIPYHFVTDRHGDQVQLPCTERNLTEKTVEAVMARGLMPVVSIRGRDEIRLASFQALGGGTVLGPWSDVPPPPPTAPKAAAPEPDDAELASDLDDLLAEFDDATPAPADPGDVDAELAALLDGL